VGVGVGVCVCERERGKRRLSRDLTCREGARQAVHPGRERQTDRYCACVRETDRQIDRRCVCETDIQTDRVCVRKADRQTECV